MSDIHVSSVLGDPYSAEGQKPVGFDSKNARQEMPSKNTQNVSAMIGNQYPVGSLKVDTGPVIDGMHDDARQDVPSPDLPGNLDADGCATDIGFGSIGPYRSPDYPSATKPPQTGFVGSLRPGGGKLSPPRD